MWQKLRDQAFNPRALFIVYLLLAISVAIQLILIGPHLFSMPTTNLHADDIMHKPEILQLYIGQYHTDYNNYIIFKRSFFHLLHGTNLYSLHPTEHWDFYKYSPTFAFCMGMLAYLPDVVGLSLWNVLNVMAVFFAIRMLPFNVKTQCALLWFVALELLTCIQNSQSNGLMCGLMILAYACMQQRKILPATLWLVIATYIKVYGALGFCLFLFYPDKLKFILYAALWTIIFAALPLTITSFSNLVMQYHNWATLLKADTSSVQGMSVSGWLHTWFGINAKTYVTVAGLVLFIVPFMRFRLYHNDVFRLMMLAFMLLWMIIFNPKAESPTYIIAIAGVGIWYFTRPKTAWRTFLLWFVFIVSCLTATDLLPLSARTHFIYPYTIKAFPCIILWCVVFVELMRLSGNETIPERAINPQLVK